MQPQCHQDICERQDLWLYPNSCFSDLSDSLNSMKYLLHLEKTSIMIVPRMHVRLDTFVMETQMLCRFKGDRYRGWCWSCVKGLSGKESGEMIIKLDCTPNCTPGSLPSVCLAQLDRHETCKPVMVTCELNYDGRQRHLDAIFVQIWQKCQICVIYENLSCHLLVAR